MKVGKVEKLRTRSFLFQLYQSVHHTTGQQRSKSKCIGVSVNFRQGAEQVPTTVTRWNFNVGRFDTEIYPSRQSHNE